MGGIDLFDILVSLYKDDHKSNKWYRHVAVVNGWILYKRHFKQLVLFFESS